MQWAAEWSCSVCRIFVLCLQNVRALSAEHPCSVYRMFVLCPRISVLSAAYPQSNWLAKLLILVANKTIISNLLIVIAERKSPNKSQDASYLNSQHFICRFFSAIPRTLCEVSADSSWGVCKLFMRCPRLIVKCLRTLPGVLCFPMCEFANCLYGNSTEKHYLCPVPYCDNDVCYMCHVYTQCVQCTVNTHACTSTRTHVHTHICVLHW